MKLHRIFLLDLSGSITETANPPIQFTNIKTDA